MTDALLRAKYPLTTKDLNALGYMMFNMDKFFNKEEKIMITTTNTYVECIETPEEIQYKQNCKKARDEAEDKIAEIRLDLSKKLTKLREDYLEQIAKSEEANKAKMWRRKYDALIEAGFSEAQAWEMTMKSFELD